MSSVARRTRFVDSALPRNIRVLIHNLQEVKAAAAEAVKDLAVHEKQQVGLEERSKHAKNKAKKLKKSVQDVSYFLCPFGHTSCFMVPTGREY